MGGMHSPTRLQSPASSFRKKAPTAGGLGGGSFSSGSVGSFSNGSVGSNGGGGGGGGAGELRPKGDKEQLLTMQRATRLLQHLAMSLRALTSTNPRPEQAAEVLASSTLALSQLAALADSVSELQP